MKPQALPLEILTRRSALRQLGVGLFSLGGVIAFPGCGYTVGAPYATDIRTVHVPTFECADFRRGYELQLTEAVNDNIVPSVELPIGTIIYVPSTQSSAFGGLRRLHGGNTQVTSSHDVLRLGPSR